jgi:hypothetical protein
MYIVNHVKFKPTNCSCYNDIDKVLGTIFTDGWLLVVLHAVQILFVTVNRPCFAH